MTVDGALRDRARAVGVETDYEDTAGRRRQVGEDTLRAVLDALEGDLDQDPLVEATTVVWTPGPRVVPLRLPPGPAQVTLTAEDGATTALEPSAAAVELPPDLPHGAHHLRVEVGASAAEGWVLVAPSAVPDRHALDGTWGVFAPAYALDRGDLPRCGGLGELRDLADVVRGRGGTVVATLPLLATFDDEASPYAPLSRLAWNERYLEVEALPEWPPGTEPPAGSPPGGLIDPAAEAARVRRALDLAVSRLSDARRAELDAFTTARPHVDALARFRAGREGRVGDPQAVLRHRYGQWTMDAQLRDLSRHLAEHDQVLHLDLPIGVHPDGFDVHAHPGLFATAATVGAPPDDFFAGGQNWGFPPVHPQASRRDGHAYLRASLRHHLAVARLLRIDHVMALHRLWWIPEGRPATDGAYVRYPADELAAVVTLAAGRAGAVVVGEDLGTVPDEVEQLLADRGILGTYAAQFALDEGAEATPPDAGKVAVVNTHDMQPFAAFWTSAHPEGADEPSAVLPGLLRWLGRSAAAIVIATLEDLWGETRPQNVPGTVAEHPNWRRRMARSLPELADDEGVVAGLGALAEGRRDR